MATIRWNITDRMTGKVITIAQPTTDGECNTLKVGIKALSRLSVRGGSLYEG